jgi:hypothetical protein
MQTEGPQLDRLLHRLTDCPADFLQPPRTGMSDGIDVAAIVCDHMRRMVASPAPESEASRLRQLRGFKAERLRLVAMVCWLLHDSWFVAHPELAPAMWRLLCGADLGRIAKLVRPERWISDPDRREELVRFCLQSLGLRPAGETEIQALDRLTTLDSAERKRILQATAAAERRARQIREAMARASAQDAANRYGE